MRKSSYRKSFIISLAVLIILTNVLPLYNSHLSKTASSSIIIFHSISKQLHFSDPEIIEENDSVYIYVNESDVNRLEAGKPVLPVNLTVMEFPFGTKILGINYETSPPEQINLTRPPTCALRSRPDTLRDYHHHENVDTSVSLSSDPFPSDWIDYHTGGGLSGFNHTTFLVLQVYPVRYFPEDNHLQFIQNITIRIFVDYPTEPLLDDNSIYDLLILSPSQFSRALQPLITHKNELGIRTTLVPLEDVYKEMFWYGRDPAEQIKYFIKNAIEQWGIHHVLLVGGLKGQSFSWHLPVRYSHVVPWDEQEYAEPSFISDLYYADIYDGEGDFSTWDSNDNNIFAEWVGSIKDNMDLYPDVYLGRLACRNQYEVKIMVDKIITYEQEKSDPSWFNNMVLVGGDSYNDSCGFIEGEIANQAAWEHMPGFTPVKVWTSEQDINRETVKAAMDPGCGFAYFCGHGSPASWATHYPPDGAEWCTGFNINDMIFLRNGYKLPVVIVGGCHNAQFNVTFANFIKGIMKDRLQYFSMKPPIGQYWHNEWVPNCWAWMLTRKIGGGGIATIANTGLGTHGENDQDRNDVPDYLEILDGWLEIRFFKLFGEEHVDILGENHGETLTGYLHRFLGNEDKMDVKMVQQWALLGDPSLKMGGYE